MMRGGDKWALRLRAFSYTSILQQVPFTQYFPMATKQMKPEAEKPMNEGRCSPAFGATVIINKGL